MQCNHAFGMLHPSPFVSFYQLDLSTWASLLRAGPRHPQRPALRCGHHLLHMKSWKMPPFLSPCSPCTPQGCHSQWLMAVKVQKSNSCSSGCHFTPQHSHRIGLRLRVQLKSLLFDFFFFPLLLPQLLYWLVLGVLPLINHLDPNAWIGICFGRKLTLTQVTGQLERVELIRGPLASTDTPRLQASRTRGELLYLKGSNGLPWAAQCAPRTHHQQILSNDLVQSE